MPATDYETSSAGKANIELFQQRVADRFLALSSVPREELLSLQWIRQLLDVFLCCHEDFRSILYNNKPSLAKPPMDRLINDFSDRSVKALDVCNAIRDGIEQIWQWQKLIEIVLSALGCQNKSLGEGQFRRAKKALIDLAMRMLDEKESCSAVARRNRSFGNNNVSKDRRSLGHFRSLSWSVSRSWSAVRQLQAIGNNLVAPRGAEVTASNGLATTVFTMSSVLLFLMWALVAAIPCQDRGLHVNFSIPRHLIWTAPIMSLHDRILEESKKRDRKNECGLLREIQQIEKCSRHINQVADLVKFPLNKEEEADVRKRVQDLAEICESLKDGLGPFERQVRQVFHRIVRSRAEGLDSLGRAYNCE